MSRCKTCGHDAAKLQERLESARRRIEFWESGPHKVAPAHAPEPPEPSLPAPVDAQPSLPVVDASGDVDEGHGDGVAPAVAHTERSSLMQRWLRWNRRAA